MNQQRRKMINAIISKIETLRAELEEIASEERGAFENLPEEIQDSERGMDMDEKAYVLEDVGDQFDVIIDQLNEVL